MFHRVSVFNIHIIPESIFFSHFIVEQTEAESVITSLTEKRNLENKYLPSIHSIIDTALNQNTS